MQVQPRIIRQKFAPKYLGMCQEIFNELVRPHVKAIKIGRRGVGFCRHELDAWIDEYIKDEGNLITPEELAILTN